MSITKHIASESEMLAFGAEFARSLTHFPVTIELIGDVGAGKTTFTRGLARGLGIKSEVTSPSFTISKSYAFKDQSGTPRTLTHYDFYRLQDPGLMQDDLANPSPHPALPSSNGPIVSKISFQKTVLRLIFPTTTMILAN